MHGHPLLYWAARPDGVQAAHLGFELESGERLGAVDIEDALPEACRGAAFAPEPAVAFFKSLPHWLAPPAFIDVMKAEARKGTRQSPVRVPLPPVDLKHFGFVDDSGVLQAERVRDILRTIAPVWGAPPWHGMLHALIAVSDDLEQIKALLIATSRYDQLPEGDRLTFAKRMLPPECRDGTALMRPEQGEFILHWLRREPAETLKQDELIWRLNFRELGLIDAQGRLNEAAAKAASDFIWARRDEAPDFQALKAHLAPFQRWTAAPKNTDAQHSRKPMKRTHKAGRMNRRRRR